MFPNNVFTLTCSENVHFRQYFIISNRTLCNQKDYHDIVLKKKQLRLIMFWEKSWMTKRFSLENSEPNI